MIESRWVPVTLDTLSVLHEREIVDRQSLAAGRKRRVRERFRAELEAAEPRLRGKEQELWRLRDTGRRQAANVRERTLS